MGELYACAGYYPAVHDSDDGGCGTVFSPGVGRDDIHEKDVTHTIEPTDFEKGRGIGVTEMEETYTVKGYCPVCDLDGVIVVKVGELWPEIDLTE